MDPDSAYSQMLGKLTDVFAKSSYLNNQDNWKNCLWTGEKQWSLLSYGRARKRIQGTTGSSASPRSVGL